MALNHNGTKLGIPPELIPEGFIPAAVVEFTDDEYEAKELIIDIPRATVENATETTTFTNIMAEINTAIITKLTADYKLANTVDSWAILERLDHNLKNGQDLLTNVAVKFVAFVKIFAKTS